MRKSLDGCLEELSRHALLLGFNFDPDQFKKNALALHTWRDTYHLRHEVWEAWAHSVSVDLHLSTQEAKKGLLIRCVSEIGWSSSGRDLAQAVSTVALYQRAIDFAAFAECVLNGAEIPQEEAEAAP